jgi:hypothetical protein
MHMIYVRFNRFAIVVLFGFAAAAVWAQGFLRNRLPASHPLIGHWRVELPQFNCFEEYEVRADGTRIYVSGQEQGESEFIISAVPSPSGFYKWTDRVSRNNAKPDCSGSITPIGDVAINYILLHRDGNRFLLCEKEDVKSCIGPFVRKKPT